MNMRRMRPQTQLSGHHKQIDCMTYNAQQNGLHQNELLYAKICNAYFERCIAHDLAYCFFKQLEWEGKMSRC